jgi:hypothetical protein
MIQWSVQSIAASGLSREHRFYFDSSFTIQLSVHLVGWWFHAF